MDDVRRSCRISKLRREPKIDAEKKINTQGDRRQSKGKKVTMVWPPQENARKTMAFEGIRYYDTGVPPIEH